MKRHAVDLEELSDAIGKEIRKDCIVLGLDVAQKRTGVCLLRTTRNKLYIEDLYTVDIKGTSKNNVHKKLVEYAKKLIKLREELKGKKLPETYSKILVLEDCWFGRSVWVTKTLARFETVAFLMLRKWADEVPDPIQPVAARKLVGFEQDRGEFKYDSYKTKKGKTRRKRVWIRKPLGVKDQIKNFISDVIGLDVEDDNLADGIVLALVGVIKDA